MNFILNLTRREIRSSWRRLMFFFLCIALGVGSVVALRSLIQNLTRAVGTDARALLTADLEVSSTNDFTPAEIEKIESVISGYRSIDGRSEAVTAAVMARSSDPANSSVKFVELKGVDTMFPLVGEFSLTDGSPFDPGLMNGGGAIVASILLEDLNVKVGERLRIGESDLTIRATFDEEPGGSSGFRLGPRVFISKSDFEAAGIIRNNGRVRRRILYRTTEDPTPIVRELRSALKGTTVQIASYKEQQENISDQFTRTENYLALTGLLILVLGGVGVWNVARAFVEQKRKTVAVLKCLGAGGGSVIAVYVLQTLSLGLIGSILGAAMAQGTLWFVSWKYGDALPEKMTYGVPFSTAVAGIILGVAVSLLFSILPLMQIRNIKPKLLLRDENNASLHALDRSKWSIGAVVVVLLLGLAIWQAGSVRAGVFFLGGLTATSLMLFGAASLLLRSLRRLKRAGSFSVSQAVNSLYRPGNQTRVVLLAVGLGTFVVMSVYLTQNNLLREFDFTRNQRLPSLFFVDIQKSQIEPLTQLIADKTGEMPEVIPTVRARITHVNGEALDYQDREVRQQQGQIGREFALTYRDALDRNEKVIDGEWWTGEPDEPQVSVESQMAGRLKVEPGDSITFDISGRRITARVANIRDLDIRNTRTAFVFVFRPGTLDRAPQSYGASVLKHMPATDRQRLQRETLDRFPNVQIFDVDDILAAVRRLVDNVAIAVSFVGLFVTLSGILILIGSTALTRSQRVYENAVLKTLGANRRILLSILLAEYSILGLLAGAIGTAFALILSAVVCRYLIDIRWEFEAVGPIVAIVVTAFIVTAAGVASSLDLLYKKPLNTLRSQ
ncbi:MAG: ABC transporter permease [Acidobacteria bacterium]|nr:ABC transporter permease [Acidobacteriota bacterium]MCW5949805.1 ABC transporter permease [Pyrinomonadaceae bacterium]